MNTPDSIGTRIVKARAGLHLSQAQLAQRVGIAPTQLSRYEMDKNKPRPEMLQRLAEALDVQATWLESGEGSVNDIESDDPGGSGKVVSVNLTDDQFVALRRLSTETGKNVATLLSEAAAFMLRSMPSMGIPPIGALPEAALAIAVAKILSEQYGIEKPNPDAPRHPPQRTPSPKKPPSPKS